MKLSTFTLALVFSFGLTMTLPAVSQHVHQSHADIASGVPVPTQRYAPDASLKEGMRRARVAVDALNDQDMEHLSRATLADHANTVQEAVNYMFANCRLAPKPDAALHSILLPMLNAARALKVHPGDTQSLADLRAALARYPEYFDDPGWQPTPLPQPLTND